MLSRHTLVERDGRTHPPHLHHLLAFFFSTLGSWLWPIWLPLAQEGQILLTKSKSDSYSGVSPLPVAEPGLIDKVLIL